MTTEPTDALADDESVLVTDEMANAAWEAFRNSNKPAPFNQVRDAIAAALRAPAQVEGEDLENLHRRIAASEHPESREWYHPRSNTFSPFPGNRTRSDWGRIGAHSNTINEELPDD